jgi:uncharacterized glyoxalase superfamily protein PhnB
VTTENSSLSTAPEGYGIVTPWIISSDTTGLLDFIAKAFGARDVFSLEIGGGRIGHAEARIGDSVIMGFDAAPDWPFTPAFLRIYVEDADNTVDRACAAGATMVTELGNSAWGDRGARIRDPFGNIWWIMSRMEDVPEDEAEARWVDPLFLAGMEYAIRSFDQAMTGEGNNPDDCPPAIRKLASPVRAEGVQALPAGHKTVEPWIISRNTGGLLEFMSTAFGAEESFRVPMGDGSIGHAEARIGDSTILAFDSRPEWPDTPAFLRLYVDDGDATFAKALAAGATAITEMTEMYWGDRTGRVRDPFGNLWWIQSRVLELTEDEAMERATDPVFVKAMEYVSGTKLL